MYFDLKFNQLEAIFFIRFFLIYLLKRMVFWLKIIKFAPL